MAIDIKPDKKKSFDLPSSFNVLFYYSIILFIISLGSYLLVSQWNAEMQAQVGNREEVLQRLEEDEDFQQNREAVFDYKSMIDDYLYLFWNRHDLDDFFAFLENSIHPNARLESVSFSAEDGIINLEGEILNFENLEQQYTILKEFTLEREVVGWVEADNVERMEDEIKFQSPFQEIYQSPVTKQLRASIETKNNEKAIILKEINSEDYTFEGLGSRGNLINDDWYEVVAIQEIEPIQEVGLEEISEGSGNLGISFNFNIHIDQELLKP